MEFLSWKYLGVLVIIWIRNGIAIWLDIKNPGNPDGINMDLIFSLIWIRDGIAIMDIKVPGNPDGIDVELNLEALDSK